MATKAKPVLLASSPTFNRILVMIGRYYGTTSVGLEVAGDDRWYVHNTQGSIPGVAVEFSRGRYRFIRL